MEIYERNGVWCFDKDGQRHKFVTKGEAEHAYRVAFPPKPAAAPVKPSIAEAMAAAAPRED